MSGGGGGHGHAGGGHSKRRVHEEEHEEHENHERWLVSYADMMTLLMVLFIVMFAISQVDHKKFLALKTGLSAGFGSPIDILIGGDHLLDPGGAVAPDTISLTGASGNAAKADINVDAVAALAKATQRAAVAQEVKNLQKVKVALQKALLKAGVSKGATFRFDERGLVVSIATDKVLFDNGNATISRQGGQILDTIAPVLVKLPNQLSVDGHTNSIPIHTAEFTSNWELSSARATGVLRYLDSNDKISVDRMSASAFADTRPLLPPSDPRSVIVNRRVEIVILARIDDSAGRAVEQLGNGRSVPDGPPNG